MCRCCQTCLEDTYWNCFEEKFCYDVSIANYNPDEDDEFISPHIPCALSRVQSSDNNNLSMPVCAQPLRAGNLIMNSKIHEEDYRRETQNNVAMLGPEVLSVFASSQIFKDHQPTKLRKTIPKSALIGSKYTNNKTSTAESYEDKLIRRLDDIAVRDVQDSEPYLMKVTNTEEESPDDGLAFTPSVISPPEENLVHKPLILKLNNGDEPNKHKIDDRICDEIILRPHLIDMYPHLRYESNRTRTPLRTVKSVPYFNIKSSSCDSDFFSITYSTGQISMTPEVPSISFLNLPKNYENTPTVEKYKEPQSLYSIQTANVAKSVQIDYSMPRYFRRTELGQSTENFSTSTSKDMLSSPLDKRHEKERNKRLQRFRESLPPLLVHSSHKKDEVRQFDLRHY